MAFDPCRGCGACCTSMRVDFDSSECSVDGKGVPAGLIVPVSGRIVRMQGTDDSPPRCAALFGDVGAGAECTIYPYRPSPCREFSPLAALGIGDDRCERARRRHGLAPIGSPR